MKNILKKVGGVLLLGLVFCVGSVSATPLIQSTRIETVPLYNVEQPEEPILFFDVENNDDFLLEDYLVEGAEELNFSAVHGHVEGGRSVILETNEPVKVKLHGIHYELQRVQDGVLVDGRVETEVVFDKLTKIEILPLDGEAEITISWGDKFSYRVPFADYPQFFIDGLRALDQFFPGISDQVLSRKYVKLIEMNNAEQGLVTLDRSQVEVDELNMGFRINDPRAVFDGETSYKLYYEVNSK